MSALLNEGQGIGQLMAWNSLEVLALCLEVDAEPDARKVEERGDRCRLDHLDVGHADELRHEERRRPHDRRHELSASGCRCLNRAREVRMVAKLLHHRNRE